MCGAPTDYRWWNLYSSPDSPLPREILMRVLHLESEIDGGRDRKIRARTLPNAGTHTHAQAHICLPMRHDRTLSLSEIWLLGDVKDFLSQMLLASDLTHTIIPPRKAVERGWRILRYMLLHRSTLPICCCHDHPSSSGSTHTAS